MTDFLRCTTDNGYDNVRAVDAQTKIIWDLLANGVNASVVLNKKAGGVYTYTKADDPATEQTVTIG